MRCGTELLTIQRDPYCCAKHKQGRQHEAASVSHRSFSMQLASAQATDVHRTSIEHHGVRASSSLGGKRRKPTHAKKIIAKCSINSPRPTSACTEYKEYLMRANLEGEANS